MHLTLFAIFAVLQVIDAWSTLQVLKRGGAELNRLMSKLMDLLGACCALVLCKALVIVLVYFYIDGVYLLGALVFIYLLVTANNLNQLRKSYHANP